MLKKIISIILILLHLAVFGPIREALAFSAASASYRISAGALSQGGSSRSALSLKLGQDVIGEPCAGRIQSPSYILNSGFISTIQSTPPALTQDIPYQTWPMNSSKDNAFDLDDYFLSPDDYPLSFSSSGNSNIKVTIDPATHIVSFSQGLDWSGVEKVYFRAADTEGAFVLSNQVTLQVENTAGSDKPVIVETQLTPSIIKEGDLIKLIVKARDLDNQDLSFTYSDFFTETRHWKEADYWFSEALWQTASGSTGHYNIRVTVTDPGSLTDTASVLVNIGNINHPPVLEPIADISANEGELVVISPKAADSDNDPISFYYSHPFDSQGKWLTGYDDAGVYNIQVTASDGIDTISDQAKIIINNTNRPPQVTLTLSKYTVKPNEEFAVNLLAVDPDVDTMSFVLRRDGAEIASGPLNSSYTATVSFSNSGDHTISATVTDSNGLSTTAFRGVDVAEPNPTTNPVMGDFNGDSLSDLGLHNSQTGTWEIALSDQGVFRNAVDWLTGFGDSRDWLPIGGDFNADAKTDIGVYNLSSGELKIALSTGSGFAVSGIWLTFPEASGSWQPFTGNFNGDKYTDFGLYHKDTGEVKIALGTGSGFGSFTTWLSSSDTGYIALSGDFNGDSLTDLGLFKKSTGEFKVIFSDSQSFVDSSTWLSSYALNQDPIVSDFNNDGLTDIGYWDKSSLSWYYAASNGTNFQDKGLWLANFGASSDQSATSADFNADGLTDAAVFNREALGIERWTVRLSTNKPADLLTQIDNGIGGKTQVSYTYAASTDNPGLPFPVYVASSVSLVNTFPVERTATYTQGFIFSGGYYDALDREFRGFSKVRITDPITNNYSETYFYQGRPGQDGALKGQIEKLISSDGNGRKISELLNTYEVRKVGSASRSLGFPALTEAITTIWEENGSFITTKNQYTYDNIGNLTGEKGGRIEDGGWTNEKIMQTVYAQAYEVGLLQGSSWQGFNRPLEAVLKDKDARTVSKKSFEYDSKGNLSKETVFIFNPFTLDFGLSTVNYSYDSFGNLISSTNPRGYTTTTAYETDFYTYPKAVTNSLGQAISYEYDPKLGVATSVTDPNGASSSTTYDSLGRPLEAKNAYNQTTVTYSYPDFNTKTTTNALGLFKTELIDGLGRKYQTLSSGEDGESQRNVSTETFFNNRGQVEKESLSHYANEDPSKVSYIRYEYDIRGRVKKTVSDFPGTLKDAESSVNYLSPLYTETTDPLGHRKGALKDISGNVIEVTEFTSGGVYKTRYVYDIQNNLTQTIDNLGNTTQIFYDSIGRKLKMSDPDMGTWAYEYDLAGNLIKQTDAKGQILEFTYDALNRLINKTRDEGRGTRDEVNYYYDDPTKENSIGRLSKVTDSSGSTEFFYDKLGREIKSVKTITAASDTNQVASPEKVSGTAVSETYVVERSYDVLDRLTSLTYPDGEAVEYAYDPNSGLLEKVFSNFASPSSPIEYVKDITYTASGQIKTISYGNGTSTDYTYGQDLRLSRILTKNEGRGAKGEDGGEANLQDLNYQFDRNGNLTTLIDNLHDNIRSYSYDDLDRLSEAHNTPSPSGGWTDLYYRYDSIGNMTYKSDVGAMGYGQVLFGTGAALKPHALTSAGDYSYQYDPNGNMIAAKNKTLAYDSENRLIKVSEGSIITSFLYDGDGGRIRQTQQTATNAITRQTLYIGSLFEITRNHAEPNAKPRITKHIFAGAARVCSVTRDEGKGTTDASFYHSDHLGSSSIVTDASGNLVEHYEYTPYGSTAIQELVSRPSSLIHHLYTGKELDSTGLYFFGARYYDPEIGRFISADSIVQAPYDPQSLNRYAYCRNNPINYVDPTGHWSWKKFWHSFAGAFLGAVVGVLTYGAGFSLMAAGFWGGLAGGSLSGGLEGGWKGALIGGAIGGALGAFGGWGVDKFGAGFGVGMLVAGAGYAAGTGGWEGLGYFGGGVLGGLAGTAVGAAYQSMGAPGTPRSRLASQTNNEKQAQKALCVNAKDKELVVGSRKVGDGPFDHMFTMDKGKNINEMGADWKGKITAYKYNLNDKNSVMDAVLTGPTPQNTMDAIAAGQVQWSQPTMVNSAAFDNMVGAYGNIWGSSPYVGGSFNSNYAVNTWVYGSGGEIKGLSTWRPSFSGRYYEE